MRESFKGVIPAEGSWQQIKEELLIGFYLPVFEFIDPDTGEKRWFDPRKYSKQELLHMQPEELRKRSKVKKHVS